MSELELFQWLRQFEKFEYSPQFGSSIIANMCKCFVHEEQ